MPVITAAVIAGGAALAGGAMSNASNARQASRQMQFQYDMSGSAHQREVKDLEAAGLNPILSGTGGHGASTPPGASAQMSDIISPAVSSAQQSRRLKEEVEVMKSAAELNDSKALEANANIGNLQEDTKNKEKQGDILDHQELTAAWQGIQAREAGMQAFQNTMLGEIELSNAMKYSGRSAKADTETVEHGASSAKSEAQIRSDEAAGKRLEGDIDRTTYGRWMRYLRRFTESAGGMFSQRGGMSRVPQGPRAPRKWKRWQ